MKNEMIRPDDFQNPFQNSCFQKWMDMVGGSNAHVHDPFSKSSEVEAWLSDCVHFQYEKITLDALFHSFSHAVISQIPFVCSDEVQKHSAKDRENSSHPYLTMVENILRSSQQ